MYKCAIHLAIEKYGENNFSIEELYYGPDFDDKEREYIKLYNSQNKLYGYNIHSGGRGFSSEDTPDCKLKKEQVEQIKDLLMNSDLLLIEINKLFDISFSTISGINLSDVWKDPELDYPLRQNRITDKQLLELISLLKNTNISYDDISLRFGLKNSMITPINMGRRHYNNELNYPIRKSNSKIMMSIDANTVKLIENELLYHKIETVSQKFNVSSQTVGKINRGIHPNNSNEYTYPIRKKGQKS